MNAFNSRILVVDDEETIRDTIRSILQPREHNSDALTSSAASLFGQSEPSTVTASRACSIQFEVEEACSGPEALQRIEASEDPHAVVFLDMRMPGWDGLETARRLRELDPLVEILFVTAQSDYDIDEVVSEAGPGVGYLCKPFAPEEIRALATKGVYDWNKLRNLESLIRMLGEICVEGTTLQPILSNVFDQVVAWTGADGAALVPRDGEDALFATGALSAPERLSAVLSAVDRSGATNDPNADLMWLPFDEYVVVTIGSRSAARGRESHYLLDLFLRHSTQALSNARLRERAVRNEKLSAIGQALGVVAHDLRSPIGTIHSAIDLARSSDGDEELLDDVLDMIGRASTDALAIVEDVLDFTRDAPIQAEPLNVASLFEVIKQRASQRSSSVELEVRQPEELTFRGSESKILRVLQNLVNNAMEALEGCSELPHAPKVELDAAREADRLAIRVRDNGPGIPAEIQSRLFEPFATHGKSNGTGLGLAICKQIASAHRGQLMLETGDRGTCFTLWLPAGAD